MHASLVAFILPITLATLAQAGWSTDDLESRVESSGQCSGTCSPLFDSFSESALKDFCGQIVSGPCNGHSIIGDAHIGQLGYDYTASGCSLTADGPTSVDQCLVVAKYVISGISTGEGQASIVSIEVVNSVGKKIGAMVYGGHCIPIDPLEGC